MTHRLAWVARHGPIPNGPEVCHRCDERRCCNPAHLHLGSHAENMAEMKTKAAIHIFIGDREYVGRVAIRPFDPARAANCAPREVQAAPIQC